MHLVIQDRNDPPSTQPFNILGAPLVTLLLTSNPRALAVTGSRRVPLQKFLCLTTLQMREHF